MSRNKKHRANNQAKTPVHNPASRVVPQNTTPQRAPAPAPVAEWPIWAQAFLVALAVDGIVSNAAKAASIDRTTAYRLRRSDETFAEAWKEAEDVGSEVLVEEAYRRAVTGLDKPVFQGGVQVGVIREYSDTLLTLLLKAKRPEQFRERVDNFNRNITIPYKDLENLSDEELKRLAEGKL